MQGLVFPVRDLLFLSWLEPDSENICLIGFKCVCCSDIFCNLAKHLGVGTKLLTGIGVLGLEFESGFYAKTDCRVTAESVDVGDSVVSFICTKSLSGSEDLLVGDEALSVPSSEWMTMFNHLSL